MVDSGAAWPTLCRREELEAQARAEVPGQGGLLRAGKGPSWLYEVKGENTSHTKHFPLVSFIDECRTRH